MAGSQTIQIAHSFGWAEPHCSAGIVPIDLDASLPELPHQPDGALRVARLPGQRVRCHHSRSGRRRFASRGCRPGRVGIIVSIEQYKANASGGG
eukprot:1926527-Rhodomonas_salina.1